MRWRFLAPAAGIALILEAQDPRREPESPLSIEHILRLPVVSDFELSPDGKKVAVAASVLGQQRIWVVTHPNQPGEILAPAEGRDSEPDWSADGGSIAFASDRAGGQHLFVGRPGEKEARQLTSHHGEDRRPRWSPDGKDIAFLSRRLGGETGWDLWVVSAQGGPPRRLSEDPLDEEDPRWSPDGKRIAYTFRAGRHIARRIAVVASSRGESRSVLPERWSGDSHSPRWSPDGKQLAFVSDHGGIKTIFIVSAEGGDPEPLVRTGYEETDPAWNPDGTEIAHVSNREGNLHLAITLLSERKTRTVTRGAGVHTSPRWTAGGKAIACVFEGPTYPRDAWLFSLEQGGRRRLTETLLPDLDVRKMIRPELVRYSGRDGRTITAFLYLPSGASAAKPVSLIAHPHGGPTSQWLNGWHPFEQYLTQKGFAIFSPNVRGSSGFGVDFENLNDQDWGRGDLEDLVVGVRKMTARAEIRDDRVGIWGVSYGGFLTLAALGRHPDLFTCAVEAVGMPDLERLYRETTIEGRAYLERELGSLQGNLKLYRDLSPVALAEKMKAPLLSFHGEGYSLVPYSTKKPFLDNLRLRRYPLIEFVFPGDEGRATYRFDLHPASSKIYMQKVEEFLEVYL